MFLSVLSAFFIYLIDSATLNRIELVLFRDRFRKRRQTFAVASSPAAAGGCGLCRLQLAFHKRDGWPLEKKWIARSVGWAVPAPLTLGEEVPPGLVSRHRQLCTESHSSKPCQRKYIYHILHPSLRNHSYFSGQ